MKSRCAMLPLLALLALMPAIAHAAGADDASQAFLAISSMLLTAKLAALIERRIGQPAVLGELLVGIALGPVKRRLIGWGMTPRGEVGLIFIMVGRELGRCRIKYSRLAC
ncbi:MAG: hypothetical protein U1F68_11150 [Gammaproteobacteria bacterium]